MSKKLFFTLIVVLSFGFVQGSALSCVKAIEENKIYLLEDKIYLTDSGIYLEVEQDEFILISHLQSDLFGCFIELPQLEEHLARNIEVLNKCPGCGWRYFLICDNPDCLLNQQRLEKKSGHRKEK
jgi:hypothetical protein